MSKDVPNVRAAALFGRLRELAARAVNFRDAASALSQEPSLPVKAADRERMRRDLFEESLPCTMRNFESIGLLLDELASMVRTDGLAYSAYGDNLGRMQVAWGQVCTDWGFVIDNGGHNCSRQLSRIYTAADSIVSECCEITIPGRLQKHLTMLPIGGTLDFRGSYVKELTTEEGRRRFLRYLKNYLEFLDGLIDVDNEAIIRAAPPGWGRVSTLFIAGIIALAGFLLIFAACKLNSLSNLSGWPFDERHMKDYFLAYGFLLIGVIAHVVVTLLKQDRSASQSSQALSDWILRIHVRQAAFYVSALSLCCGSLAMPFLVNEQVPWQTAFFIGYSYDSFIDLFLRRFEGVAFAATAKIQESLPEPASVPSSLVNKGVVHEQG